MKTKYTKPVFEVQIFCPNEFVSACPQPYEFHCDAGYPKGGKGAILFRDANGNGILDSGDPVVNRLNRNRSEFNFYHECGIIHNVNDDKFISGFIVSEDTYRSAKSLLWQLFKQTGYNYNRFNKTNYTPVTLWDNGSWHATTATIPAIKNSS